VANAKKYASIYIGYGHKAQTPPIEPLQNNDIGKEPEDRTEQSEPNPDKPPPPDEPVKEEGAEGGEVPPGEEPQEEEESN